MGITVELRNAQGTVLDRVAEVESTVSVLLPDPEEEQFPLLRWVDPYGDTVFNQLQAESIHAELTAIAARARTGAQRAVLDRLINMARACSNSPHHFLVFVGD